MTEVKILDGNKTDCTYTMIDTSKALSNAITHAERAGKLSDMAQVINTLTFEIPIMFDESDTRTSEAKRLSEELYKVVKTLNAWAYEERNAKD